MPGKMSIARKLDVRIVHMIKRTSCKSRFVVQTNHPRHSTGVLIAANSGMINDISRSDHLVANSSGTTGMSRNVNCRDKYPGTFASFDCEIEQWVESRYKSMK